MPRSTKTIVTIDCDVCKTEISETWYVGAMAYGIATHISCWVDILGPVVANLLGLDEIRIRRVDNDAEVPGTRFGKPVA